MMNFFRTHRSRISSVMVGVALFGGGFAVYRSRTGACCSQGAACCKPGAPCCTGGAHVGL
jgi:hypothetical protein